MTRPGVTPSPGLDTTTCVIYMRSVPGYPDHRALTQPLSLVMMDGSAEFIPVDFAWDGSSVPWVFQGFFPRHKHPIASARHDYRCHRARTKAERRFADEQFRLDVATTSWPITAAVAYAGVRIGALLGLGKCRD